MPEISRGQLAHLYFTGQLLRHMPGRIWGLGYYWASGSSSALSDWVFVNLAHISLSTYFALWGAVFVLSIEKGVWPSLLVLIVGCLAYTGGWWLLRSRLVVRYIGKLPGFLGRGAIRILSELEVVTARQRIRIFILFSIAWTIYYISWLFNGLSYPDLGATAGAQLGGYYMIAWFVGYVSFITPSGIGVRELVFSWLAKDFPVDAVALMAIVGRLGLLLVDIVMGIIFAPFVPRRRKL